MLSRLEYGGEEQWWVRLSGLQASSLRLHRRGDVLRTKNLCVKGGLPVRQPGRENQTSRQASPPGKVDLDQKGSGTSTDTRL